MQQTDSEQLVIIPTKLDYGCNSPVVPDNQFKISPSAVADFYSYTSVWFHQQFLGENKFQGNTASVRGTCVHWLASQFATNGIVSDSDVDELNQYLQNHFNNPDVDVQEIERTYGYMWDVLRPWIESNPINSAEQYVSVQITPHVILQGQLDYTRMSEFGLTVGDYKSTTTKSAPSSVQYKHRMQVHSYAWAMRELGHDVQAVEINYVKGYSPGTPGKPNKFGVSTLGKSYPAEVVPFLEPYTDADHEKIGNQIKLIARTMEYFFINPHLADILFKDNRLNNKGLGQLVKPYLDKVEDQF